jgi:hypothetical protein
VTDDHVVQLRIDNRDVSAPALSTARFVLLLWGLAGCGKTTLAATAPGKKLWLLFDNGGTDSIIGVPDILVLDLSGEKHQITAKLNSDDPFGLEKVLNANPDIETIVFDSLTAYTALALENAVASITKATLQHPTLQGYGHRNALVLRACTALLRLTKRTGRNIIFIAHEDAPTVNDDGVVMYITVALGGKMANAIGIQLSEIWWMSDTGKEHRIAVRNCRTRQPMKSRMFNGMAAPEFVWRFDPTTWKGEGITHWIAKWKHNGGKKIPLPA